MTKLSKVMLAVAAGLTIVGGTVQAAMIVEDQFGTDQDSWAFEPGGSTPGFPTVSQSAGTLQMGFSSGALFDQHLFTTGAGGSGSSSLVTLDWTDQAAQSLQFSFNANGAAPLSLAIFFERSGTRYQYDVASISAGSAIYGADLTVANFNQMIAGVNNYSLANTLLAVDLVGIQIVYPASSTVTYNLDYVLLDNAPLGGGGVSYVPEPGTYAALMTVFLSMGVAFRRDLRSGLVKLGVA